MFYGAKLQIINQNKVFLISEITHILKLRELFSNGYQNFLSYDPLSCFKVIILSNNIRRFRLFFAYKIYDDKKRL